jgi:pimeloyl-ACP methyl ester carboxylesterase
MIGGRPASVGYDITGTGPGLVLVHGTGADRRQWQPLIDHLAGRFTIVAPDYAGSGDTTDHGGPVGLADLADEVLAAADHAGLVDFHLVGHSLGAAVATRLAATHPDRVRSLALHAGWVRTTTRMAIELRYWLTLLRLDAAHGSTLFCELLLLTALGPGFWRSVTPEQYALLLAEFAAGLAPGTDRQTEVDLTVDLTDELSAITAPTLVLASAHDQIIPPEQQQALLAGIAHARYAEIDAGHGAPAEDPAGFVAKLAGFLLDQHAVPVA